MKQLSLQAIEYREEEISKIRHDFNNYLVTARYLASKQDKVSATEVLEEIKDKIKGEARND